MNATPADGIDPAQRARSVDAGRSMRVAIVSTYPPRPCGIGTFSRDLRTALLQADPSLEVDVFAIVRDQHAGTAPEVAAVIRQELRADYLATPALITERGADVVLIEHEYGIFGGPAGSLILTLVRGLQQPFVLTLHTVLSEPPEQHREVLTALCTRAAVVTVFTETARRMIVDSGVATPDKVQVVPHGAPTELLPASGAKDPGRTIPGARQLQGRTVLSTFGLISPGKGLETAIEALVKITATHPEVLYLIAGQTHPEVVNHEGEQYRLALQRLVRDRGLDDHVHFLDHFLSTDELAALLSSTDLYLTPYRSREQIVSGALTFAVVAGCPVVSTPYFYAQDLLGSGAGVLVPFDDPTALAGAVVNLLDDPAALAAAAAEARRIGSGLAWPAVGAHTLDVLRQASALPTATHRGVELVSSSPPIRLQHLLTLVDDVGIIQHADGVVPDRASGYCVDDVARLIIVALALNQSPDDQFHRIVTLGLSFLRHAGNADAAGMHNLMAYDRRWLDQPHAGDHLGRAAWALGTVIAAHPPRAVVAPSLKLLTQIAPLARTGSLRCIAFTALGLSRPPLTVLSSPSQQLLQGLGADLLAAYTSTASADWQWFEPELTYDNARLAQALIAAGDRLDDADMLSAGLTALKWYRDLCLPDESTVQLVGNKWRRRADLPAAPGTDGDEQPLDAAALVEALAEAYVVTGQDHHGRDARQAFEWFLGRNHHNKPVYDFATGGCHDGLGPQGVNANEGAESTLAYYQALQAIETAGLSASLQTL